jgi:hypothetical protein
MKKFSLICALVLVLAMCSVASAEVQRIRVSGDVNTYGIWDQYNTFFYDATGVNTSPDSTLWATTVGLNFDADLTDNVSARLKLVNQRLWDYDDADTTAMDVGIAEAYVVLQEMLYEPLTVTVGRQPLYYGRGFVLGSNVIDPEGSIYTYAQLSQYDAFDAIKAELDYEDYGFSVDLVYSKISEGTDNNVRNAYNSRDDYDLWFVNVNKPIDAYDSEVEVYYLGMNNQNTGTVTTIHIPDTVNGLNNQLVESVPHQEVHTVGARGSMVPIENLDLYGEVAYQFGDWGTTDYDAANNIIGVKTVDISSWGAEVGGDYLFADVTGVPKLGLCYTFREGEDYNNYPHEQGDMGNFWTPFMRKSDTAIYGWNGRYFGNFWNSQDANDTAADTNMHQILVSGNIDPLAYWDIDDVHLGAKYAWFHFVEAPVSGFKRHAGDELDLSLTYDYTEDVQLGLVAGWFWPGDYYKADNPNNAAAADDTLCTSLTGSMKVTF